MITTDFSLEKIVSNVPGVIFQFEICDNGTTKLPFVSKGFETIFDLPAKNFKEDASLALSRIHPRDYASLVKTMMDCYESETMFNATFRIISSISKKVTWLKVSALPESKKADCCTWFGYMSDITNEQQIASSN